MLQNLWELHTITIIFIILNSNHPVEYYRLIINYFNNVILTSFYNIIILNSATYFSIPHYYSLGYL